MEDVNAINLLKTAEILNVDIGDLTSKSLDWLFDNKDMGFLLNWLCTYTNESNILSDCELYEYNILQKENKVFNDAVGIANSSYPGISKGNKHKLNALKKELECTKNKEDCCNKITYKYLALDNKVGYKLSKLNEEDINIKIKRREILTECEAKSEKIDELHNKIYANLKVYLDITPIYKTIQQKYFLFQMPLNNFKQECDSYNTNLSYWIQKEFDGDIPSASSNLSYLDNELNRMKLIIEETISKFVKAQCAEKAQSAKLKYLRTNNIKQIHYSEDEQRVKDMQITIRINSLLDDLDILCSTKLQQIVENFTQNLLYSVLAENAQVKLDKCRDTLKQLRFLNKEVKNALTKYKLIIVLLKNDKTIIHSIDTFLEDAYFYSAIYGEQYTLKSELTNQQEQFTTENSFLNDILPCLAEIYDKMKVPLKDVQNEITNRKVKIQNLENSIFTLENQKYLDAISMVEKDLQKAKHFIWCGPTLQPIIIQYEWLESRKNASEILTNVDKNLRTNLEYYNQSLNKIEKNRWLKYKRLLWVWFLVKPDMVITAVNQIRDYLVEEVKNDNLI